MPRSHGLSDGQSNFLRALRSSPNGLAPDSLPSPVVLRRWMRRPRFRAALESVRGAMDFATDLHLAAAAARASNELHRVLTPQTDDPNADMPAQLASQQQQMQSLVRLMRMARRAARARREALQETAVHKPAIAEPAEIARWFVEKLMWYLGQRQDTEMVASIRVRVRDYMLNEIRTSLPQPEVANGVHR